MIYQIVKNNKIIKVIDSSLPIENIKTKFSEYDVKTLPDLFIVGQDINEYDEKTKNIKPLDIRVKEGYVKPPQGYKVEGDEFVAKSISERISDGEEKVAEGEVYDEKLKEIRPMTDDEKFVAGQIDLKTFKQLKIKMLNMQYQQICIQADNEVSKYTKRKELDILSENDEKDYKKIMKKYKESTLKKRELKEKIISETDKDKLKKIDINL